eukprot:1220541-Rhodomonas_salina.4
MGTSQSKRRVNFKNLIDTAKGKVHDLGLDCHLMVYNIYRSDWYTDTKLDDIIFRRNFYVCEYETCFVAFKGGTIKNEGDSGSINEVLHHADGGSVKNIGEGRGYVWSFETMVLELSAADEARIREALAGVIKEYEA